MGQVAAVAVQPRQERIGVLPVLGRPGQPQLLAVDGDRPGDRVGIADPEHLVAVAGERRVIGAAGGEAVQHRVPVVDVGIGVGLDLQVREHPAAGPERHVGPAVVHAHVGPGRSRRG